METPVRVKKIHHSSSKGLEWPGVSARQIGSESVEGHSPSLLVVEAREEVDGRKRKEEEHRVEQDEARNDKPGDIYSTTLISPHSSRQGSETTYRTAPSG